MKYTKPKKDFALIQDNKCECPFCHENSLLQACWHFCCFNYGKTAAFFLTYAGLSGGRW